MRRSLCALGASVLVTASLLAGVPAQAAPATIDWQPCPDKPEVECGTLTVPVDWAEPDGETFELALARRQGSGDGELGTLVYGPGGPGGSGVRDLKSGRIFQDPIYQHYDVVSYDSRGIGESSPIICDTSKQVRTWPATEEEFIAQVAQNKQYIEDCRERTGPVFGHVDTLSDVRDLDAIRAALGEDKLDYYGVSYGTLRGQQYAETFPARAGRIVLDSTMDHSIDNTWDFMRTETYLREELFGVFVDWCAKDTSCSLHGTDIPARTERLYARAAEGGLPDPEDPARTLDEIGLALGIERSVVTERWAELADYLKSFDNTTVSLSLPKAAEPGNDPSRAIWCNDWDYRISSFAELRKLTEDLAEAAPNVRFSSYDTWAVVCLGWPGKPTNPPHKLELDDDLPPMLITNARYDPATVYPWAQAVAEQGGQTLVTYDGGGHGMYFGSTCSREYIHDYLFTGGLPAPGTHCPVEDKRSAAGPPLPPSLADAGFSAR